MHLIFLGDLSEICSWGNKILSIGGHPTEGEPTIYQAASVKYFHSLKEVEKKPANALWRPYSKTHKAVDFIQHPNEVVQVTVSKRHAALDVKQSP